MFILTFHFVHSISMAQCKTAVTPLLTHWSYCSLALSHRFFKLNSWRLHKFLSIVYFPDCCDKLFELFSTFADNPKKKAHVWPLQMMLLVLSPKILEEITNADAGAPCSPQHLRKKQFIDDLKRALVAGHHGSNKHLTDGAAVTCVRLCKASTYINTSDSTNVLFLLVQSVVQDLKVRGLSIFGLGIIKNLNLNLSSGEWVVLNGWQIYHVIFQPVTTRFFIE